ncbi:MAG: cupin-like domain-containing protein [Synechococcaceae cyanobacterium SM2_3_1]|nr:cupin-like domain-containing protein [Synechococcaceae cyanobacterium SM2_3_1]
MASKVKTKTTQKSTSRPKGFQPQKPPSVGESQLNHLLRRKVAESKLADLTDEEIITALFFQGVDPDLAQKELQLVEGHPYFQASERFLQLHRKLESIMAIRQQLTRLSSRSGQVEICSDPELSSQDFLDCYYATNTPVCLKGMIQNWSALTRWSPEYLRSAYGEVEVEVQMGRQANPRYERELEKHRCTLSLREYVDRIVASGPSNDLYMVANNGNLDRDELQGLLADIQFIPQLLDPTETKGKVFFWFGPAGTITPLHHDPLNVLFSQVYGCKRFKLISPDQTPWLYNRSGVFSEVNPAQPDDDRFPLFNNVQVLELIVEPGDVLFIPVGWWHWVESLEVSISLSFTNFLFPNSFEWQNPLL